MLGMNYRVNFSTITDEQEAQNRFQSAQNAFESQMTELLERLKKNNVETIVMSSTLFDSDVRGWQQSKNILAYMVRRF